MTADLDLSPEAVERLAAMLDRASGSPVLRSVYLNTRDAEWCAVTAASTLRALAAENARLRSERDAAWQAGAEAMREAAANVASNACLVPPDGGNPTEEERLVCEEAWRRIRAIPIPDKVGKA